MVTDPDSTSSGEDLASFAACLDSLPHYALVASLR